MYKQNEKMFLILLFSFWRNLSSKDFIALEAFIEKEI